MRYKVPVPGTTVLTDVKQEVIITTKVKKPADETEKGVALAPSEKDLKPWYSEKGKGRMVDDMDNDRRYLFSLILAFSLRGY